MMLAYKTLVVGELQTNCYLVWNKSKECLIIDPGGEGVEIGEEIRILGLVARGILATHGHFDHILGVLDLKLIYEIPFYCSSKDKFLLDRAKSTARYFLKRKIEVPDIKIDYDLDKIEKISVGEEELKLIKTPGHSPGGVCFYNKKERILFSGDTVFAGSIGRTDSSYGSKEDLDKSLKKIWRLSKDTVILPGHGEETTVKRERLRFSL